MYLLKYNETWCLGFMNNRPYGKICINYMPTYMFGLYECV